MNNLDFLKEVIYQERIHRELHGKEHAQAYARALRIAAKAVAFENEEAFEDATFDMYGLAVGGPFVDRTAKVFFGRTANPAVERVQL